VRRYPLNKRQGNEYWINPLLTKLNLIQPTDSISDPQNYWKSIEEWKLLERIGKVIKEINNAAGYHVLQMVEYLPPQKKVIHVSFNRNHVKHRMEIVLRSEGIVLMFSASRSIAARWDRYFSNTSSKASSTVVWEQIIHPGEILEENIQAWLSYLLSGLDKKFRLDQMLQASANQEAGLNADLRKASA
jgi:hypothetical protein